MIKWYHTIAGACWLAVFASLKLADPPRAAAASRRVGDATLIWALNTGCLAFFSAMHAVTQVPVTSDALSWLAYNALCVVPLMLLALIATSSSSSASGLPLLFASAGLLMDTWKIADELTALVSDGTLQMFIRFLTLGAVGFGVVFAGWAYNKHKALLAEKVEEYAARACGPCRKTSGGAVGGKGAPVASGSKVTSTI